MIVGTILLAAGSARRMGEDKLLADLGGKPVIMHALETIGQSGLAGPIVAVRPGSALSSLSFPTGALLAVVQDHAGGMGHSLAAAIREVPLSWDAAIVCLADMPFVKPHTLLSLAEQSAADKIVRPSFGGRPGNPVSWGRSHFVSLAALVGDQGGGAVGPPDGELRDGPVKPGAP